MCMHSSVQQGWGCRQAVCRAYAGREGWVAYTRCAEGERQRDVPQAKSSPIRDKKTQGKRGRCFCWRSMGVWRAGKAHAHAGPGLQQGNEGRPRARAACTHTRVVAVTMVRKGSATGSSGRARRLGGAAGWLATAVLSGGHQITRSRRRCVAPWASCVPRPPSPAGSAAGCSRAPRRPRAACC